MFKKLLYICMAAAVACLLLPLCFGLWSEDLTVGAHITLATPEPTVSAGCQPAAEPEPPLLPDVVTEIGGDAQLLTGDAGEEDAGLPEDVGQDPAPDAEAGPDDGQSGSDGGEGGISPETPASAETEAPPEAEGVGEDAAPGAGEAE